MLVISRKVNESLMTADGIEVTVVAIHGDKVWQGIRMPPVVSVHRGEVAAALGRVPPNDQAPDDPCRMLAGEVTELAAKVQQHPDPPQALRALLVAKRLKLAALRQQPPPE